MKRRALFLLPLLFLALPSMAAAQVSAPTNIPACQLTASPTSVILGQTVNLTWHSQNTTQGHITSIGAVGTNGVQGVIPTGTGTTYVGTFVGPGGTATCKVTISVLQNTGMNGGVSAPGTFNGSGNTVVSPGTVGGAGTIDAPGTVDAPDKLGPAPSAGALPVLPTAQSNITLSNNGGTGLVPCGGANDRGGATGCQACDVVSLAQNIINFLIGLSIPLAAALFAWAGVIYFMSGVVDKLEKARKIFSSTLIGFSLVVGGYLLIETALHTLLAPTYFTSWNQVTCSLESERNTSAKVSDLINLLPGLKNNQLPPVVAVQNPQLTYNYNGTAAGAVVCQNGSSFDQGSQNCQACYDNGDGTKSCEITAPLAAAAPINSGCPAGASLDSSGYNCQVCYDDGFGGQQCETVAPAPPLSNTDCSAETIQAAAATGGYNLTAAQAQTLSCIAVPESACGRNTSVATTPSGQVTSATGMFQIVMGYSDDCHSLNIPVCTQAAQAAGYNITGNLECSKHYRGGVPIDNIGQACKAAASNIACNASAAACLVAANNGKFTDWTADSRSSAQAQCIQRYAN